MIYGERIKQARQLSALTQSELAEEAGVHQTTIAQIESGRVLPSADTLSAIAEITDLLPTFFSSPPIEDFPTGSLAYRARKGMRAIDRDKAYQFTKMCIEQARYMGRDLTLPRLPNLESSDGPREAANSIRSALDLDAHRPIPHLVNVLERKGFLIIGLPFELPQFDAFSTWTNVDGDRPIISVSAGRPGDRLRFSVAHELGHIVLHKGLPGGITILEREADEFASEFLLPEDPMRRTLTPQFNLTAAAKLKQRWGVSMQALIRRARSLGIITYRHYRYLFEQLSRRGWRTNEPVDVPSEKPRTFRKMVEISYGLLYEAENLASAMHVSFPRAKHLLSEYATNLSHPTLEGTSEYVYSSDRQSLS